jgi:hypothetical protein
MKDFKLILDVNEVNLLIKALGNLPYNQVNELMIKIHTQAKDQLVSANGHDKNTVLENGTN